MSIEASSAQVEAGTDGLSDRLARTSVWVFSTYAVLAAFTAYFCMYAFRKPYAAGTYTGQTVGPLDLKDALIISQLVGYALSKWLGVKFLSELAPERRAVVLLGLIAWAELALVVFALTPTSGRVVAMFFNGLPLGAVWGLVFGFLEGRRTSEILGAGLSCAYIVASGAVKGVGSSVMTDYGVPEQWMPATTGLIFLPLFVIAVWALHKMPPPSAADQAARIERVPMYGPERRAFFFRFFSGLIALTILYVFLTACRDFRDSYAAEIWTELGRGGEPAIFALTELPIAFAVMLALALLYLIKSNRLGLLATHVLMIAGSLVIGASTLLWDVGLLSDVAWMIGVGLGLYLAYVPYGCVLFDRMIAATGVVATAVFMIYVTDAAGYAGSVALVLYKKLGHSDMSKVQFFRYFTYFTAVVCTVCFTFSAVYFVHRSRRPKDAR